MTYKKPGRRVDAKGRSIGEVRHVRLRHYMLRSPAWQSLGPVARSLLIEVWARHNGINNGEISFSVREAAERLCIHRDTVSKAFHELENKGFLKARQRGSFTYKVRHASEWKITDEPFRDKPASKDFMRWKPTAEKQKTVLTSRTDGPNEQD